MTTTNAENLLAAIRELWDLFPDWRFGQMIANLTQAAGRDRDRDGAIWDVEDAELLAAARRLIDTNRNRQGTRPEPVAIGPNGK